MRIPPKYVFYYRCPHHKNRYVLSIAFAFDREEDVYHFAFSYPYSYTRLQKYLETLEARNLPFFKREIIGETIQGRRVDMVTIGNIPDPEEEDKEAVNKKKQQQKKKRKTVIVTARIHPGETPSSYVCQGMMNFLLSDDPVAQALQHNITFRFVPMLNPDGVYLGNYRTSLLGQDLNRCWQDHSPHAHPTLAAVKGLLENLSSSKDEEVDLCLDLHAHTSLLGAFVYGNSYEDVYRFQRHTLFPKHLSYSAEDFSTENTAYNKDPGKSGTSRRFFSTMFKDKVNCYTLEVSFHGFQNQKTNSKVIKSYNEEEYLNLGGNICHALLEYYCTTSYITADDFPAAIRDMYYRGRGRGKPRGRGVGRATTAVGGRGSTSHPRGTGRGVQPIARKGRGGQGPPAPAKGIASGQDQSAEIDNSGPIKK